MLAQFLALLAAIAPTLTDAAAIAKIITTLEAVISVVTEEVQAVLPMIKNIIAALKTNGTVSADQMAALQALDAATDAAFEDAAAKAGAASDSGAAPAQG